MIIKLYDSTIESVLHNIKNLKLYSATTDIWCDPYMSYIIHEEWELQSTAFGTLPAWQGISLIPNTRLKISILPCTKLATYKEFDIKW